MWHISTNQCGAIVGSLKYMKKIQFFIFKTKLQKNLLCYQMAINGWVICCKNKGLVANCI